MGVADVRVPAILATSLAWLLWVPAADILIFGARNGWIHGPPQFGMGAVGGWWASTLYSIAMGALLYRRWRRAAWQRDATALEPQFAGSVPVK